MKSKQTITDMRPLTFGELCEAIAEEELPAAVENEFYLVRRRDLKRFMQASSQDRTSTLLDLLPSKPDQIAS